MSVSDFIKRHSVPLFFVLTFAWFWGWMTCYFVLTPDESIFDLSPTFLLFFYVGGTAPSLMGIILTRLLDREKGSEALFGLLQLWRVKPFWYVVAVLTSPILLNLTLVILWTLGVRIGGEFVTGYMVAGIPLGLSAGLMEEFGWRGFALPKLQTRYTALNASLIIGLLWGAWHVYPSLWVNAASMGALIVPVAILGGPIQLTAYAILMTWVLNNTRGSLTMAILMHASFTASQIVFLPILSAVDSLWIGAIFSGLLWLLVLIVVAVTGPTRLAREAAP
jgi:membrane protease YdiL (CAAX protease family)